MLRKRKDKTVITDELEYVVFYKNYWGKKLEFVSIDCGVTQNYELGSVMYEDFLRDGACDVAETVGEDESGGYEIRSVRVKYIKLYMRSPGCNEIVVQSIRNSKLSKILA